MNNHRHCYLIEFQYLGFRYHGWQKQPAVKTVQEMMERTVSFVLKHDEFKLLASGRTDAMVSAEQAFVELFLKADIDGPMFLKDLNYNLPADIRALSIEPVGQDFNVIQDSKEKEYNYLFTYGSKIHPFCAPFLTRFAEQLDVDLMSEAARLFEGKHNFINFCKRPSPDALSEREVFQSEIVLNELITASFLPEKSWLFRVKGPGFMRHQVRMMMGALAQVGNGELSLVDLGLLLESKSEKFILTAPASGLMIQSINFQ